MLYRSLTLGAALLAASASALGAQITGPSSSDSPYMVPVAGGPTLNVYSILTAGNTVGGYKMVGVPDGIGAYSNGNGTMTMLVNHELQAAQGVARAHGGTGSFDSRWVINTTPGPNFLQVISGQDLDNSVVTTTNGAGTLTSFARYCSADLAPVTAFYNSTTGNGTQKRILLNGEESTNGRAMAHVVDASGANTGIGYQLTKFDGLNGSWENLLAHPNLGDTTLVMANSDGGNNRVYAYVGTKTNTGLDIDKAGLTNGTSYGIQVKVAGINVTTESRTNALGSASPVYSGTFTLTPGNAGTTFLRPEDGAWDPSRPNDYYFVTTDQYDQVKDGVGSTVGRSRLWRMRYTDANNPTLGGTIDALLDGTEPIQMLDNITVVPGVDGHTRIVALEDVGGSNHNGKVWIYDADTDGLTLLAQHDPARNGDVSLAATAPFNNDEEFSGVIDARDTLGLGWFLVDDQQHYAVAGQQVEGGQLLAFYAPSAAGIASVPEPSAFVLAACGALGLLWGYRRKRSA